MNEGQHLILTNIFPLERLKSFSNSNSYYEYYEYFF